jgi:MFS family permease
MLNELQRKRAFNAIILTQCLGMLTTNFFQNGFYLNYFTTLGVSSAAVARLFSVPPLLLAFLMIPFAFWADRAGKLKLALAGQVMIIGSQVMIMGAGWGGERLALPLLGLALLVYCVGGSLQGGSWFALLSPIIPREIRGRFFGRLRVTFMTVSILFTLMITQVLKFSDSMAAFQVLLGLVVIAHVGRYFSYARIPELESQTNHPVPRVPFRQAFKAVLAVPGFNSFNSYIFLIALFSAGVPIVFGLMQKDVFGFSAAQITLMGTLFLCGSVAGNLAGGFLVDRFGTRIVFLIAHVSIAVVILGMLARHWMPWTLMVHVGLCVFAFSLIQAINGIAITSELLALIPAANKSLSTAVSMSLFSLGVALSGLFVARSISLGILAPEWSFQGAQFSAYDSLLLAFATLVLLLLATIGLVPVIVKKVQLMPGSGYPRI